MGNDNHGADSPERAAIRELRKELPRAISLLWAVGWNPKDRDEYGSLDATPDELRATLELLGRIQDKIDSVRPLLEARLQRLTRT